MTSIVKSKNATRIKGVRYVGTLADEEVWKFDLVSGNMIPGTAGGSVLTAKIAHVMPSIGDDSTGVVGDLSKPYETIEAALTDAVSGDTIKVYEDITVTTTAASGIYKDGVSYEMVDNITITKSTSGNLFTTSASSIPFVVTGRANYTMDTVGKNLILATAATDVYFEYGDILQTLGTTFGIGGASLKHITLNGNNLLNTGGGAFSGGTSTSLEWNFNTIQSNTSNAINITSNSGRLNFNGAYINSQAAYAVAVQARGIVSLNVALMRGLDEAVFVNGTPFGAQVTINGNVMGIETASSGGVIHLNGFMPFKGSNFPSKLTLNGVGSMYCGELEAAVTITNGTLEYTATGANTTFLANNGGDVIVNFIGSTGLMPSVSALAGTTIVRGLIDANLTTGSINVSGGLLKLEAIVNYTINGLNTSNETPIIVNSGTLYLTSSAKTNITFLDNYFTCIRWVGGTIISNGGVLTSLNESQYPIKAVNSGLELKVYAGGLTTNRTEFGGVLGGKKQMIKFTIDNTAIETITINGTVHTNTVTASIAAKAAEFLSLINAGAQGGVVTSTQDNPGVDDYIYVESDTDGVLFTFSDTGTIDNEYVRDGSYAITEVVGGTIIEDIDVI